jgi:catechol 2,3-dioxygenase-like lactoylglutathione lyase family enzyme
VLERLDHVTIRTANLAAMTTYYQDVVGLHAGERPPFSFGGAWLYLGERAVVHLVEADAAPVEVVTGIEHFAFRATGLASFTRRLESHGVDYRLGTVPGFGIRQVHFRDPDGNHVEVGFSPDEDPGA